MEEKRDPLRISETDLARIFLVEPGSSTTDYHIASHDCYTLHTHTLLRPLRKEQPKRTLYH